MKTTNDDDSIGPNGHQKDKGLPQSEEAPRTAGLANTERTETETTPSETQPKPLPPDAFFRGDHVELAKRLLSRFRCDNIDMIFSEGNFYHYESTNGYWMIVEAHTLHNAMASFSGKPLAGSNGKVSALKLREPDVKGVVRLASSLAWKRDFFPQAAMGLVFQNGFVEVRDNQLNLVPHSPAHRATFAVEHDYDPTAQCPKFERFLEELFRGDIDAMDKSVFLQEFAGACLLGLATKYQTCCVLVGEGSNGKSTLLDLLTAQFPKLTRAAIPPQQWSNSYYIAQLPGIRLNAVSEIPDGDIASSEQFKAIISGDPIQGRPIYSMPFEFRPVAGHLFSANSLPNLKDLSHGFWRRWCVIQFNRKFEGEERVVGLAEQIIAEESAGIINWMMVGVRRLLKQGKYNMIPSSEYLKSRWKRQCDTVAMFLEEGNYENAGPWETHKHEWTPGAAFYAEYQLWCRENGHKYPVANNKFAVRLKELGKENRRDRRGSFYGIKVTEEHKVPPRFVDCTGPDD